LALISAILLGFCEAKMIFMDGKYMFCKNTPFSS
jgi:hypothetical protein